jgi:hypothetical protein
VLVVARSQAVAEAAKDEASSRAVDSQEGLLGRHAEPHLMRLYRGRHGKNPEQGHDHRGRQEAAGHAENT